MSGTLSVVVPVYKVEPYLDRCVESIVNQTYSNLEIILVDDGSPDRSGELCDLWQKKDSRIRVIHKENGGLSDARNAGITAATGEYLAFVDSDDYVDLRMYETMIGAIKRTNSGIACCGRYIVKNSEKIPMHCMEAERVFSSTEAIRELLLGGDLEESACDKVYKKVLFRDIQFPKGEINEDIVIMPKLLDRAERIVHVGMPFYYYYQNCESITRSVYSPSKRIMVKHLDDIQRYLSMAHPELLSFFAVLQARYCLSVLYLLLDNRQTLAEYREDYRLFYTRFRQSFRQWLKLGRSTAADTIKGYLVYYRLYYLMHAMKKGRR